MRVAVAVDHSYAAVVGHAGKCRRWLVFIVEAGEDPVVAEQVELPKDLVWHHYKDDRPHPLGDVAAVIAHSAGESFKKRMEGRGIQAAMTSEDDPARAAAAFGAESLPPPKPRPIGDLVCKVRDMFSDH